MGKKMTKAGMVLRRAIRADIDTNPDVDHKLLRSKHGIGETIIDSAMTKSLAEWDAMVAATPDDAPPAPRAAPEPGDASPLSSENGLAMPGIEQGIIKFARKPAKMGVDYIFWIPRVYIKNGLVDPSCEYEVYLRKKS